MHKIRTILFVTLAFNAYLQGLEPKKADTSTQLNELLANTSNDALNELQQAHAQVSTIAASFSQPTPKPAAPIQPRIVSTSMPIPTPPINYRPQAKTPVNSPESAVLPR